MSDVITQWGSNLLQVLAYMVGPVVLGVMIVYGISRTWKRNPVAAEQDDAVRNLYAEAEDEREAKEKRKQKSSNPIDIIERKSGTTG